jgi:ABC-type lipoprotein release transport system permease subunit
VKSIFIIALRNIFKHKVKYILVGIIVFVANLTFFFSASFTNSAKLSWRAYLSQTFLGHYHITSLTDAENDYAIALMGLPRKKLDDSIMNYLVKNNIDYSPRLRTGGAYYNETKGSFEGSLITVVGVDLNYELNKLPNLVITEGSANQHLSDGAFVWHELAERMNWKIGESITLYLKDASNSTYPYSFTIAGILNQKHSAGLEGKATVLLFPLIFVDYKNLTNILNLDDGKIVEVAIWANNPTHAEELNRLSHGAGLNFFYAEKAFGMLYGINEFVLFFGNVLQLTVLLILLVASFNINLMGFFERQSEIGTMIAIGAKPRWAVNLLLSELVIHAIIVSVVSMSFYVLVTQIFIGDMDLRNLSVLLAGYKLTFTLLPTSVVLANFSIILSLILSALYPMYLTTKINPAQIFMKGNI